MTVWTVLNFITTWLCPESDESSPCSPFCFFKVNYNIIQPSRTGPEDLDVDCRGLCPADSLTKSSMHFFSPPFMPHTLPSTVRFRHIKKNAKSDCLLRLACLSLHVALLSSHWTHFHEVWYLISFQRSIKKIIWLKSDKKSWYVTWRKYTFLVIPRSILLTMRNVPDRICREK